MDYGKTGIVFEDGEVIGASAAAFYGRDYTLRRLEIHHVGNDAVKASDNDEMYNCWMHHLGMTPDSHADGIQIRHGSHYIIKGNNFDMPKGLNGFNSNATIFVTDAVAPTDDVLVEGNWLNGGNYTTYFLGPNTHNMRLINNRFGRDYNFGPLAHDNFVVASGNVWDDTGALMDINN
jgi:hypothetical protein